MATRHGQHARDRGWRNAGLVVVSVGLNAGLIALLVAERQAPIIARAAQRPLYLEIEPRAALATDRATPDASVQPDQPLTAVAHVPVPARRSKALSPTPSPPVVGIADPIEDQWRVTPGVLRPTGDLSSCAAPHRLSIEERRRCDARWARLSQDARAIVGTGDPERDATFARQGARRLAAWENQRAEPPRGDPPCLTPHPVAGCEGVNIQVELFSTRDGLLPNLRKRRE